MIRIPFWAGEFVFAIIWLLVRIRIWKKRGRINWKRELALMLLFVNYAVLIRFSFFPLAEINGKIQPLVFDYHRVLPLRINLIPFVQILWFDTTKDMLVNLIGNVAMFIPTGIIYPLLFRKMNRFWKVFLAGVGLSLTIELLQLPFAVRATDVDDLILNTSGVIIGYIIHCMFIKKYREK